MGIACLVPIAGRIGAVIKEQIEPVIRRVIRLLGHAIRRSQHGRSRLTAVVDAGVLGGKHCGHRPIFRQRHEKFRVKKGFILAGNRAFIIGFFNHGKSIRFG